MTLADFVGAACYADVGARAREQLKIRLLDTLGVSFAALAAEPGRADREPPAGDARTLVERRAARYVELGGRLDFQDVYVSKGGVGHPSDSIGAVLAAAVAADAGGADVLTAIAIAYAVQTRLADVDPVSASRCAMRAGVGKAMRLNPVQLASVLSARGVSAEPDAANGTPSVAAADAIRAARLASEGAAAAAATGQADGIAAGIEWSPADLDAVLRTIVRPHAAGVYLQSAIDVALTVSTPPLFRRDAVRAVRVKTFQAACAAIGSDIDPLQRRVDSPAHARRSLSYVIAAALLDRCVGLAQFTPERIRRSDVQTLLHKVAIIPVPAFTARFPDEMRAQVEVGFDDGAWYCTSASSFKGFTLQPMDWHGAEEKFMRLAVPAAGAFLARRIARCVHELDGHPVRELADALAQVDQRLAAGPVARAA